MFGRGGGRVEGCRKHSHLTTIGGNDPERRIHLEKHKGGTDGQRNTGYLIVFSAKLRVIFCHSSTLLPDQHNSRVFS